MASLNLVSLYTVVDSGVINVPTAFLSCSTATFSQFQIYAKCEILNEFEPLKINFFNFF